MRVRLNVWPTPALPSGPRFRPAFAILVLAGGFAAVAPSVASAACPASSSYSSLVAGTPGLVGYWRVGGGAGAFGGGGGGGPGGGPFRGGGGGAGRGGAGGRRPRRA